MSEASAAEATPRRTVRMERICLLKMEFGKEQGAFQFLLHPKVTGIKRFIGEVVY